jgi:CBS domain-containing protein
MKAGDIMTRDVFTVARDASIQAAIGLMLQNRISGLPVVDTAGKLIGVVTEGDFLRRAETGTQKRRARWLEFLVGPGKLAGEYAQSHGRKVEEVMTADPYTVTEDVSLEEVVATMESKRVKRLPVVKDGKVVGIISRANLLRALATVASEVPAGTADDAAIRDRLLADMKAQAWAPAASVNPVVRNGVVELWGNIFDDREREGLKVMAENIPGVTAVRDHLVWVDPTSGYIGLSVEDEDAQRKAS